MARNAKAESTRVFGGSAVPAGKYNILRALVCDDTMTIDGVDKTFDALYVEFNDGSGNSLPNALRLNGCWRKGIKSDGTLVDRARGTFYADLRAKMTGKSFSEVVEYINSNYKGKDVVLSYEDYTNNNGDAAHITEVNFVDPA